MKIPLPQWVPVNSLIIGIMGAPYGTHGWLKVCSYTEVNTNIFRYYPWFVKIADKLDIIEVARWKTYNQKIVIKIKGIDYPEIVREKLTNQEIIIHTNQLPPLSEGEYYWKDLIGCQVINIKHIVLGVVIQILETGSNDVLIVQTNLKVRGRMKEILIPFLHNKVIKNIDLANQIIYVHWDK
ncbi:Ribosome maturation factor RimM [Candidatus Erwinia haradaeae]|uniref:Ribosome maturation factor RimM n=1 Tax=Candidatus Erwinia haradaeae TaxID=1922217 RepID=A0A451DC22_9GAMM|nr:ribosome maturation factor RimM [Candidatus Erwinia haradaeae]VFP83897.1 Ribosome maturation factor RimM [Candidatus Erwinia haradaeae]